jgi:hypothetical protein
MIECCARCAIIINVTSTIVARWEPAELETLNGSDTPERVNEWYASIMEKSGGDAIFAQFGRSGVMIPIATWYGDKVCSFHLWQLAEWERFDRAQPRPPYRLRRD